MTEPIGDDPLEQLRRADPAADGLPSASLARLRARVQQEIRMDSEHPATRRPGRWGYGLGAVAAAVVVLAVVVLGPLKGVAPSASPPAATLPVASVPAATAPGASPSGIPGPGAASCVEPYSLANLAHRTIAFDGTVTGITGDEVAFRVTLAYRGVTGGTITLTAMGMTGTTITSAGGPTLTVGNRYLVAGEDHFAWPCGYTQPYDATVASSWAATFGR